MTSQFVDELNERVKRLENLIHTDSATIPEAPYPITHPNSMPQKQQTSTETEVAKTVNWFENDAIVHSQPNMNVSMNNSKLCILVD